jgi:hypothetical protein
MKIKNSNLKQLIGYSLFSFFISCNFLYAQVNENNTKWISFEKSNFIIQYPSNWDLNESGQMGTSFILFSPLESEKDIFKENVNLIIQDVSAYDINLDQYTEMSEGQIKKMVSNSNLISSDRVKIDNNEYHKLLYTGDQGVFHLKFEQYYWLISGKAYVLTLTTELSKYDDFVQVGEKILNSFKIVD